MSQLLESSPTHQPNLHRLESQPLPMNGAMPDSSQQGFDILTVLWRWKWLPILGAILGAGLAISICSATNAVFCIGPRKSDRSDYHS